MLTKLASMSVKLKQSFLNLEESRQKKLKLHGKSIYATVSVKYLGTNVDENLNWHQHINNVAVKLNRANAMLSKLRHFVNKKLLSCTYSIHVLLGHRILIPLKDLYFTEKLSAACPMSFLKRNKHIEIS